MEDAKGAKREKKIFKNLIGREGEERGDSEGGGPLGEGGPVCLQSAQRTMKNILPISTPLTFRSFTSRINSARANRVLKKGKLL